MLTSVTAPRRLDPMLWQVLAVVAVVLSATALGLAIATVRRLGERDPAAVPAALRRVLLVRDLPPELTATFGKVRPGREKIAFIANPTKPGVAQVRELAYRACSMRYLPEPIWIYTAINNTGTDLAREAIEAGADVLVAVGGDGTVRAVAEAAIESNVPMGIIPVGTGNLLARNLELPVNDSAAALRTVLDGEDTRVDVGRLVATRESGDTRTFLFLVLAGVGIDAEMVAGATDRLKRRIGWLAYFLAATRHFTATRMRASVSVDGSDPVMGSMRTVLVANCGRLPGGVVLIPDARINDGMLDITTLDARAGVAGWAELFGEVVLQGANLSSPNRPEGWRVGRIDHARGTAVTIELEAPQPIQADGESLGRAVAITARVEPGVLAVRTRDVA